jgi:hypothetical protein
MKASGIPTNIVEAGPAWTDDVVAQGAQFAPSAFPAGQTVTVYTKSRLVVGFESITPTDALKLQVADLQAQVTALQNQMGGSPSASPKGRGKR